ncbi:MAG: hypothetical protein QOF39_2207 [Frankiales bacterium]|nr:hypothetical protein [Frankiales bacterium]
MTGLDLGLFPGPPGGSGSAAGSGRRPPRRQRQLWIRRGITLVVCLAMLGVMIKLVFVGKAQLVDTFSSTRDYKTAGFGTEIVAVPVKATVKDIASGMLKANVVRSTGAFTKAFNAKTPAPKIAPGYYQLREHMSAASAVALLLDPASKLRTKVTIPEGTPLTKALGLIAAGTTLQPADLAKASADPNALDLPTWASPTKLEGFLYPATYQFDPRSNALGAMQQMVAAFNDEAVLLGLQDSLDKVHHTPYEVLTIASIIEKEAGKPADGPKIARVIYNRLAKKMKLQLDSTLNYVLPERKGHLTQTDLQNQSPYNTYQHLGLPPTPIDSPGERALKDALTPADGNWTFFVTIDKQGDAEFTNNYQTFLHYKAVAKANGVIS